MKKILLSCIFIAIPCLASQQDVSPRSAPPVRGKFYPVKAVVTSGRPTTPPPAASLNIASGRFFSYALPQGWRVGEDGQFALSLVSADNRAITVMVGNAGLPPNYPPQRFVHEKLMAMQPQNLQISQPRAGKPVAGFAHAFDFDISYSVRGAAWRGTAKCNINTAYDTSVMAMTAAITEANQWPGYSTWLPQVADQISATNGGAFGIRGIMQQNLQNSIAYAEAARNYREWSQKNWQQVTDARGASEDRRNAGVRDVLGNVQPYTSPFGDAKRIELPTTYTYYWMNRQGNMVGTDDPSANPNQGSTSEWRSMKKAN